MFSSVTGGWINVLRDQCNGFPDVKPALHSVSPSGEEPSGKPVSGGKEGTWRPITRFYVTLCHLCSDGDIVEVRQR
jgi:hypothetical protein